MKLFRLFKVAMFLALIGIGITGSLTACIIEDGGRGGYDHR
jgi:hypothetical protein